MRDKRGRFLSGFDPDRHRLTRKDRRRGYLVTMGGGRNGQLPPYVVQFIACKVQRYYRHNRREKPCVSMLTTK